MNATLLRRASIFLSIAGLGITLAWLLDGSRRRAPRTRTKIEVADVPPGTRVPGGRGIPGIELLEAEKLLVSPVQEVVLDDGSRVRFRGLVLRGDSERPLPSTNPDVRRASIVNPVVHMLPVPKTREQYEASAKAVPTVLRAPEGILENGPGDAFLLHLRGGVRAETLQEGTPWTYTADETVADLRTRTLRAPGAVSVESAEVKVEGRGLVAADQGRTLTISEGAHGSVAGAKGVRVAGGDDGGETRFRCTGPLTIVPRTPAAGAPPAARDTERWNLVLEGDAVVEQGPGALAAKRVEFDLSRAKGGGSAVVEVLRAAGAVELTGGDEGRDFRGKADRLTAWPRPKGETEVHLEGKPSVRLVEKSGADAGRTVDVAGGGTAVFTFPDGDGPFTAIFRGGGDATVADPAAKEGEPARRRELHAATLSLSGKRSGDGSRVEVVVANGDASLREGGRTAKSRRIEFRPLEGGASRALLDGDVRVGIPGGGALEPLGGKAAAKGDRDPGTMLLETPGRVVLEMPRDGATDAGAKFAVEGATTLRRLVGEQEIYRLTCKGAEGSLQPGNRGVDGLTASGDVRLAGREEGEGRRTYEFRGERLEVRGAPGSKEAGSVELTGPEGPVPAAAAFTGEDGRPFSVSASRLHFERATGAFRAEGKVRGTGVIPESTGAGGSRPARGSGRAEIACGTLEGVLDAGGTDGSTKVVSLLARDDVWVKTESEYASGDRLTYEASTGDAALRGDPARVTARSDRAPVAVKAEDGCEARELHLVLREGRLVEARAPSGGRVVWHRFPDAAAKDAAPAERYEAVCKGPLVHTPATTSLGGGVSFDRSVLKFGEFVASDRIEGAEEVTIHHAPAKGGGSRLERAVATSAVGGIDANSRGDGWHATGVSRVEFDAAARLVTLESSPGAPRFRFESGTSTASCRRVVWDGAKKFAREIIGATVEGTPGNPAPR